MLCQVKADLEEKLNAKADSNTVQSAVQRLDSVCDEVKDELARKVDLRTFLAFANTQLDALALETRVAQAVPPIYNNDAAVSEI